MADSSAKSTASIEVGLNDGPVEISKLQWPGECGAEGIFLGRTRRETHGSLGELIRLEYEVYEPMAQKLLHDMATAAARRFDAKAVRIVHASGPVAPGEASVVIQVATPHRGESFAAARYLIDRLKHELPIWKREIWEHGETFVEGCCAHHPADSATDSSADSSTDS